MLHLPFRPGSQKKSATQRLSWQIILRWTPSSYTQKWGTRHLYCQVIDLTAQSSPSQPRHPSVRRRLNLQWVLIPFSLTFSEDMESNLNKTFSLLKDAVPKIILGLLVQTRPGRIQLRLLWKPCIASVMDM
ncbi:hypothetical protein Drorol1_Dr00006698 [Drosera rotundifolia]